MPAIALPVALPAAAASLAYLNARWAVSNDWRILSSAARARARQARLEKRDRISIFYALEEFATASRTADLPFLVFEGTTWSFRQTYDSVLRYAAWLHHGHGVESRHIVALEFMNCPQFVFLWLALWSLGAVPAFINYNLTGAPLVHSIRVSTARLLIVDPEIRSVLTPEVEAEITSPTFLSRSSTSNSTSNSDSVPASTSPLKIVHFTSTIQSSLPYQPAYRAPDSARSHIRPRDPAILIYTSGTTGLPKPAISSWNKFNVGGAFTASWMGLRPATSQKPDRFYSCMPLYHSSAAMMGLSNCLINGTTFVLGHRFSSSKFWKEVRECEATVLQYVGEMCRYLLAAPPEADPDNPSENLDKKHKIRIAFGNGLRPDVWERFRTRFGIATIAEFYGATEGTSGAWNLSANSFAAGAVGRNGMIAGLILRKHICIVKLDYESEMPCRDPETGLCVPLPRGEAGELLCALDPRDIEAQFQGYFGNEAASRKKVLRDVLKGGDAWFRTGDVMRWDAEGRWWFVDRIGDTYRWKSENISTAEVADVIGRFPGAAAGGTGAGGGEEGVVEEVNVYGVQIPGVEVEGRAGCAAIVFNTYNNNSNNQKTELSERDKESLMADLATYLSNSLPKYSVPLFIRLVKHMARTGNMKQQKHVLRNEGVDLQIVEDRHGEEIWWLRDHKYDGGRGEEGRRYVRFRQGDWDALRAGRARL
ncbi:hypothetical protein EPUS_05855 [Endocarpon pusillum Z07020]|uniref:Very long-chain fatty acid transport protein n=1 Tax=Endocarpon pusillum (strain Z07020 / HMAS-L-300199) TaxID=1263415 RepID=U1GG04_ENDPU|nr:uncharacterized protein EPUS_05855 [Endocarpon pusillum Z07020]ERF76582.1 hypothetical protein EPUS_05855 [Endocarpon pusillum Z07020]